MSGLELLRLAMDGDRLRVHPDRLAVQSDHLGLGRHGGQTLGLRLMRQRPLLTLMGMAPTNLRIRMHARVNVGRPNWLHRPYDYPYTRLDNPGKGILLPS